MKKERVNEMWGVLYLLLGLFSIASIIFYHPDDLPFFTSHPQAQIHNYTGLTGAYLAFGLKIAFGDAAILIPCILLLWACSYFLQRVPVRKTLKFVGLTIAMVSTCILVSVSIDPEARFEHGGAIGYLFGSHLLNYFGKIGSYILATACLLLSLLLATDFLIFPMIAGILEFFQGTVDSTHSFFENIADIFKKFWNRKPQNRKSSQTQFASKENLKTKNNTKAKPEPEPYFDRSAPIKVKSYQQENASKNDPSDAEPSKKSLLSALKGKKEGAPSKEDEKSKKRLADAPSSISKEAASDVHEGVVGSKPLNSNYQFPTLDYLKRPEKVEVFTDNLQENSRILEDTLADFDIEVKVTEVEQGPVITRYELMPAPGVKVNSIAALSDDIALAMKAASVRLIIPIPGKSAIGVEVPNSISNKVFLRELVESPILKSRKLQLPLVLGKDTSGKSLIADLAGMPHLLIAGTTGSGKTVCVNSIITGLMYALTPEELKFVIVDPKMVEMAVYNKIPHMLSPVVTDVKKAAHTLNWVVSEMENRYRLLATVGVRNIQSFNTRPLSEEAKQEVEGKDSPNVIPAKLPYIVVVIDELADLMMIAQDKVEGAITRLAQLSRAVGIHLILATQRPSVDVITGVIKANFPARISFKVASKVDSRTVLDTNGADKLLGKGDMLFLQPGHEKPTRGQACFVSDEEINKVVAFVASQGKPEYHPEIQKAQEGKTAASDEGRDELFDEAVQIVVTTRQASTSNLQRRLGLGYTRAARIIDQMEAAGIVGPSQGAKPRDIYMDANPAETIPS